MSKQRTHELYHIRSTEQQILDALLRIEELLKPVQPEPVVEPTPKAKRK